jgi:nucleotide-binding universal stress UspA family protein
MPYKDVLVQVDTPTPLSRYEIAAELAGRCGGRLTGLYLKSSLVTKLVEVETIDPPPLADLARRIRDQLQREDAEATAAAAVLSAVAEAANAECECRVINGDTQRDMITEARHADLVVVGAPVPADDLRSAAVDIAIGGGAPVLIVPAKVEKVRIGSRVLVAWNGSRESSRALRDALPLFTGDVVLEVRNAQRKHDRTDSVALCRHLERHGCQVSLKVVDDDGQSVPKWLISEAVAADCDLIVLGVYGHTRLHDFVLSDVSREMLRAPPLPLLISH